MMKKVILSFPFVVLLMFLFVVSCDNKSKQPSREDAMDIFRSSLTAEDTTIILNLCNEAMEQLKNGDIDKVIMNLCEYDDSTKQVSALSDVAAKRYKRLFQLFPVKDYELQYYSIMLEGCNDVKYKVTFATAEQTGGTEPATTMYMFNPVKVDGQWKLCVKRSYDEFDKNFQ